MIAVKVERIVQLTDSVRVFYLVSGGGAPLPVFEPGAHIGVILSSGIERHYSLVNDVTKDGVYVIAVQLEPKGRGGSKELFKYVKEGDILEISEPRNNFRLAKDASHYILMAGGIGVTPLLAMADYLYDLKKRFRLFYFCRDRKSAAFYNTLLCSRYAKSVTVIFDTDPAESKQSVEDILSVSDSASRIYMCGPPGFMGYIEKVAEKLGIQDDRLHREYFSIDRSSEDRVGDKSFLIRIKRSDLLIRVESDETAVEALSRYGVDIPVSCQQGVCSTCLTKVVEGVPDHRDMFMTDQEHQANDKFTPCVSRALSDILVIDID